VNRPLALRLQPLLQQAAEQEAEAARRLQQQQLRLQDSQGRLSTLQQFSQQYAALARAHDPVRLRNQQAFYDRLREAVDQQSQQVAAAEQHRGQAQAAWQLRQHRCEALTKVCEADTARRQVIHQRREQRSLDDHATRQFLARRDDETAR
jgi:flagellar protein FliJ